jgi:hypothetical protein
MGSLNAEGTATRTITLNGLVCGRGQQMDLLAGATGGNIETHYGLGCLELEHLVVATHGDVKQRSHRLFSEA